MNEICRRQERRLHRACMGWSNNHTALAVRTMATPRGRCHGKNDERRRRGAERVPRSHFHPRSFTPALRPSIARCVFPPSRALHRSLIAPQARRAFGDRPVEHAAWQQAQQPHEQLVTPPRHHEDLAFFETAE